MAAVSPSFDSLTRQQHSTARCTCMPSGYRRRTNTTHPRARRTGCIVSIRSGPSFCLRIGVTVSTRLPDIRGNSGSCFTGMPGSPLNGDGACGVSCARDVLCGVRVCV